MASNSNTDLGGSISPTGWFNRTKKIAVRETHVGTGWEDKVLINEQTEPYKKLLNKNLEAL